LDPTLPDPLQGICRRPFSPLKPAKSGIASLPAIEEDFMHGKQERIFTGVSMGLFILMMGVVLMWNFNPKASAAGKSGNRAPGQQGWRLLDPVRYENLTIFPVVSPQDADTSDFATLDDALASGDAVVTEQGNYIRRTRDGVAEPRPYGSAQVNQLVLVNRGKRPLVLLAGEVVSGGKQDRIIGKDRIVPVGAPPLPLDVFCVEHGRWTGGSDKFAGAKMMAHPSVREKAAVDADQAQVWAAVRGQAPMTSSVAISGGATAGARAGASAPGPPPKISADDTAAVIASTAPTESYSRIYQSARVGRSVESFAEQVQRRFDRATSGLKGERVVGVVVAFGGEVAWSDAFASSQLFEIYWPKLLRSYVVEALTRTATQENASLEDARDFLRPATGHYREETEPGVYRWRESTEGKSAQIELEALAPKPMTLHWLKVLRAN
jgi:ARG/rhodanese/phosphatase superfamily protein